MFGWGEESVTKKPSQDHTGVTATGQTTAVTQASRKYQDHYALVSVFSH